MVIPVVDLFSGPGGLGEGFSAFEHEGKARFKVGLSIEKDEGACRTLMLRAFYREFDQIPDDYYECLRGELGDQRLFEKYPAEYAVAQAAVRNEALGENDYTRRALPLEIDRLISC